MVDYVKIEIPSSLIPLLESNDHLDFFVKVKDSTGEIHSKKEANYKGMKFIIYGNDFCLLQGSLHKYFNDGIHNFNDFTLKDLNSVIKDIKTRFGICIGNFTIRNIEFGVNIKPEISSENFMQGLISSGNKSFTSIETNTSNCDYKQIIKQRFIIKVYDKGKQYRPISPNLKELIRFELKFRKMIDLNEIGFRSLFDLKHSSVRDKILHKLKRAWQSIILFDYDLNLSGISDYIKDIKLNQWSNPNYWILLDPKNRNKQKVLFTKFIESCSRNLHALHWDLIFKKWNQLEKGMF